MPEGDLHPSDLARSQAHHSAPPALESASYSQTRVPIGENCAFSSL